MRQALTSSSGYRWQAESLWGVYLRPDHRAGSDHNSYGLWRPTDGASFLTHDPNGNLIGVGSGTSDHTGAEALANAVAAGRITAPLTSASVMVSPITLTVTNTTTGIDAIESWAARVGAIAGVRWATISETARDWVSAGGVPSRIDRLP